MPGVSSPTAATIVLVHGGFVDGSGWESVYKILKRDGYRAAIVQHPTISLAGDVAATTRTVHAQNGPVILVGHSYGGVVITEAGNDPQVAGLVYIATFAPDTGESVSTLIKDPPPGAPVPPILPPQDGYLSLDKARFPASLRLTWTKRSPRSWPILKCRGGWRCSVGRLANRDARVDALDLDARGAGHAVAALRGPAGGLGVQWPRSALADFP